MKLRSAAAMSAPVAHSGSGNDDPPGGVAILKLDAERRQRAILQQTLQQKLRNGSGRHLCLWT